MPAFVLGNGSDLVVADAGMRGLVIRNRARDVVDRRTACSPPRPAAPMAMLVKRCTAEALAGLEFGISIPGTLGGAVWANAGAHGGEMRDVLEWVDAWDPASDAVARLDAADCAFAYRESRFKHSDEVVLAAALAAAAGRRRSRSRRRWPRTRPSGRRRSRWPTRTPAASSATRPATMPDG